MLIDFKATSQLPQIILICFNLAAKFNSSSSFRILVFKESPVILFTGLDKKVIGNPREYEKNVAEGDEYFEKVEIDMTIPLEETNEWE